MRAKTLLLVAVVCALGMTSVAGAQDLLPRDNGLWDYHTTPRYRESESHPLRVGAYILHPVGWILREGVFRPLSFFASSTEFTRSFFGYREPFDYREPVCFSPLDDIPDCRNIAPYNSLSVPGGEEEGDDGAATLAGTGERQVFLPDVAFEFDKHVLNDLGRGRVRQIAQLLASVPNLKVVVSGHADFIGTDEYNQNLGMRRAETVVKELTDLGIDPARMSPISYGESQPIFTEEEDWARAVNRRVQFSVAGEQAPAAAASAPAEDAPAEAAE